MSEAAISETSVQEVLGLIRDASKATRDFVDILGEQKFSCGSNTMRRCVYNNTHFSVYLVYHSSRESSVLDVRHAEDEYFVVASGSITLDIKGEEPQQLDAHASIFIPAGRKHVFSKSSEDFEGCSILVSSQNEKP